jgi:hypothetical protein
VKTADAETVAPATPADADFDPATGNIHFKIPKGDKGDSGTPGVSVKTADAETVAPATPADADFDPATGNIHFKIPKGDTGPKGDRGEGLEPGLTRIEALSWTHNNQHTTTVGSPDCFAVNVSMLDGSNIPGIIVGFTGDVQVSRTIDPDHVFQVLVSHSTGDDSRRGFFCRCPIRGRTIPVDLTLDAKGNIVVNANEHIDAASESASVNARGVAFLLDAAPATVGDDILNGKFNDIWIILRGDFVLDTKRKAIDAEFVRAELPTGDRPGGSSFGIQGGIFESWFQIGLRG